MIELVANLASNSKINESTVYEEDPISCIPWVSKYLSLSRCIGHTNSKRSDGMSLSLSAVKNLKKGRKLKPAQCAKSVNEKLFCRY
jgi:hypothetical protein